MEKELIIYREETARLKDLVEGRERRIKDLASEIGCEIDVNGIKARRLGKTGAKPRPILVEFVSHWEKRKFYASRSNLKKKESLKQIFFNEDLDKQSAKLYYLGRRAKKAGVIKGIWTYGCQIYYTHFGSETPIHLTSETQLPPIPAPTPTPAPTNAAAPPQPPH